MVKQPKPRAEYWSDEPFCPPLTVYESAPENIDTGLLDAHGTKIFRTPQMGKIGFDLTVGKR